jgi:hypothetical protein
VFAIGDVVWWGSNGGRCSCPGHNGKHKRRKVIIESRGVLDHHSEQVFYATSMLDIEKYDSALAWAPAQHLHKVKESDEQE